MVLAERCALLSAEILKSQGKYSEAAALLIKMTSEVRTVLTLTAQTLLTCQMISTDKSCIFLLCSSKT